MPIKTILIHTWAKTAVWLAASIFILCSFDSIPVEWIYYWVGAVLFGWTVILIGVMPHE